jgi:hypothetical protein
VTDASTSVASDRRLLWSGATSLASGTALLPAGSAPGAELVEALGRARCDVNDLRISFTARLGAEEVAGREDRRFRECHESSCSRSMRSRSEEITALPAVSPAALPAAISPVLTALREFIADKSGVTLLAASSWSLTVSTNR